MELIYGQMVEHTRDNGTIIKLMDLEHAFGMTVGNTKDYIKMI